MTDELGVDLAAATSSSVESDILGKIHAEGRDVVFMMAACKNPSKRPELVDFVELFPKQVDNHQIELNLAIKSVFKARTPELLKTRHPEAFNIYRRYHKNRVR